MRWRSALLTASSALLLLLPGCGGSDKVAPAPPPPRIPADVATRLAAEADAVAKLAPGSCAARDAATRFRSDVIASVARIPSRYQEPLLSAAQDLARRTTACTDPRREEKGDKEKGDKGHGKKRGHKKREDEQ
jgi:hypothetical protein